MPGVPDGCTFVVSNPINAFTGNVFEYETDISLPCKGFNPNISRFYNSSDKSPGELGIGWQLGYDERIARIGKYTLAYQRNNGAYLEYEEDNNNPGLYLANKPKYGKIIQTVDGDFVLEFPEGVKKVFSASGLFLSQVDRNGNTMNFHYDSNHRLIEIIDPAGRSFNIQYNNDGYISQASAFCGKTAKYFYENDHLIEVTISLNGKSSSMQYEYDEKHNIVKILSLKTIILNFSMTIQTDVFKKSLPVNQLKQNIFLTVKDLYQTI